MLGGALKEEKSRRGEKNKKNAGGGGGIQEGLVTYDIRMHSKLL